MAASHFCFKSNKKLNTPENISKKKNKDFVDVNMKVYSGI